MHLLSAAALGLLASEAVALPNPKQAIKKRSVKVATSHWLRKAPVQKRDDGSVVVTNDGGGWTLPVLVGGQQVIQNIDTGSADLWVASTQLSPEEQAYVQVPGGSLYDQSKSTTAQPMDGENYSLGYGDGSSSSGPAVREQVNIGGAIVPNFPIGVCTELKLGEGQTSRNTDGPVGLAFKYGNSIRPDQQGTFMEFLEPLVDQPVFSSFFRPDDSGHVEFGSSDDSLKTGDYTVVPVNNGTDGSWTISGVSFGSGGNALPGDAIDMIFDTGGAGLDVPQATLDAYFGGVDGSQNNGGWTYPCGATLPDFNLNFATVNSGPTSITIPGDALKNGDGSGQCGTWMGASDGRGSGGLPVFISQYIIWNQAAPTMSFAAQALQS